MASQLRPKGSAATGRFVQVDKPGFGGMPSQVNFHVDALNVQGTVTKLRRTATIEGQAKPPSATVGADPGHRAVGTVQTRHGRRDRTRHASRTLPLIPTAFWSPQSNIH